MTPYVPTSNCQTYLNRKSGLLADYQEATLQMKNCLDQNDTDMLKTCILKRRQLIDRIQGVDRQINAKLPKNVSDKSEKKTLEDITVILATISKIENECISLAEKQRNVVR